MFKDVPDPDPDEEVEDVDDVVLLELPVDVPEAFDELPLLPTFVFPVSQPVIAVMTTITALADAANAFAFTRLPPRFFSLRNNYSEVYIAILFMSIHKRTNYSIINHI